MANSSLHMDWDAELKDDLLRVQGSLLSPANVSLGYLILNAALRQGERPLVVTKYLLMEVEPGRDYSFEICKNVRLRAGDYDLSLAAEGPEGVLAKEHRKVSLVANREDQAIWQHGSWSDINEAMFWQRIKEEEKEKEEEERDELKQKGQAQGSSIEVSSNESFQELEEKANPLESVNLVGSITSKKYHRPDCRYAQKIKAENLKSFASAEEAKEQGYLPCKVCNP